VLLLPTAALRLPPPSGTLGRRAALSGAASAAATLSVPMPAFAKSKKKAEEEATQKATAKEARQAMKEYKYAPRPVLEGNAETGYSFKEGTVKPGSSGEMAGYFLEKGKDIQADYQKDRARAAGMTSAEAEKVAKETKARLDAQLAAKRAERNKLGEDAQKIKDFCKGKEDLRDPQGRLMCR